MPIMTDGMIRLDPEVERTPEDEARYAATRAYLDEKHDAENWIGERFESSRTLLEVTALVRGDIVAAVRAGTLPVDRYIVSATRRDWGGVLKVSSSEHGAYEASGRSEEAGYRVDRETGRKIGEIVRPYNRGYPSCDFDPGETAFLVRYNGDIAG